MGDYESPRVTGASAEATAPMVAVQADQGLPSGIGQRAPGIGPDGRVVVVQTKLPLRHGDRLTYRRWDADFNNCASKGQLNGLLANRAVPTVEAVQLSFKGLSPEQQLLTYNQALQRFQQENTALFCAHSASGADTVLDGLGVDAFDGQVDVVLDYYLCG